MSAVAFEIKSFGDWCYIRMVGREYGRIYNYNVISSYLQVDNDDFINNLKLYGGELLQLQFDKDEVILFFIDKEKAKVFINEYLEPLLIAKQLSK